MEVEVRKREEDQAEETQGRR